jgi:hypothetical protein
METHAHHLHKAPGKNFWHYFFEFFMLFLAVFCGFLVENFREHKIEKERELVYMQNLYEDLKSDTTIYADYFTESQTFFEKIDSLMTMMGNPARDQELNKIYFVSRSASLLTFSLFPNERTFEQMKAGGNLRLIMNREVADSVSSYYNSLKKIGFQNSLLQNRVTDYMQAMSKVFDAQVMFRILKAGEAPPNELCKLITKDKEAINELLGRSQYFYGARRVQMNFAMERTNRAKTLMELIKKEYQFE